MSESAENSTAKSNAEALLEKINFATELMQDLRTSEDTILEAQTKLPGLKGKQWWMKHKVRNLMSYHELLTQLAKPPEQWLTSEEVAEESCQILEEYNKEKTEHANLLKKCKSLSHTLRDAEEIAKCGEDIQSHVTEMKIKAEKMKEVQESKSDVFQGICNTAEEAQNLIDDLRIEIEREKEIVALLEKRYKVDDEASESAGRLLFKSVEQYFGIDDLKTGEENEKSLIESLTARLTSEK